MKNKTGIVKEGSIVRLTSLIWPTYVNCKPVFGWCWIKEETQENMCLEEIGLNAQRVGNTLNFNMANMIGGF